MARFSIEVRFGGGLSDSQQAAFQEAAARWARVIVGDFPRIRINGEVIQALVIDASGVEIDRGGTVAGNILGQSQPTDLLPNGLTARGMMEFDTFDLAQMETDGSLASVILHEMGHVVGVGTLWEEKGLLVGAGTANPRFVGPKADAEWALLSHLAGNRLPVENRGGTGTADGHWRENVFGDELMTGFISGSTQPLSRVTIASLEDLGYRVDMTAADLFILPSHLEVRTLGIGADPERVRRCTMANRPRRKIKPRRWSEEHLV
jgi:hypothetical protein